VLATDWKRIKRIHDIVLVSAKLNSIPSVTKVMRSLKTGFSLFWSSLGLEGYYCLGFDRSAHQGLF